MGHASARRSEQEAAGPVIAVIKRSLVLLALVSACVSTGTYNHKVAELTKARADDAQAAKGRERALADQGAASQKHLSELQSQLADVQRALDQANQARAAAQKTADDDTQLIATLKQRLEKLGENVDSLVKERGQLAKTMADTSARLEELRTQKTAAEARAATFRGLVTKLRAMIDAGQLKVVIRGGRMILALPTDILFDSGKTAVKKEGKIALARIAQVLASVPDRAYLVAGHTDNVPIHTEPFPSNWELSTRRAVEVVHLLIEQGMSSKALAAAGYGEFDPVAPNDSAEHRAQNRRIEIVLQPNLSELPPLDDTSVATKP